MGILTKYSKTRDTQSSQYTTQKEYIDSLKTEDSSPVPDDLRTPFTYQEWLQRNAGIIPGKEYDQYNDYLKSWHQNTYTVTDTIQQVKEDYYSLLSELSVAFTTPEEQAWFNQLDITNNLDLEEAIPVFTKKLKEIAIYFVNKRDAIKKAKLKYNMVGSRNALKRLFYEYLLKAFTRRQYVLNVPEQSAYNTFPDLSAVNNGFQIFIEDLYDDTAYMDKDPLVPISSYYDLTDPDVVSYYNSQSFSMSAVPWLLSTGIVDIHSDNPLLWTLNSMLESKGLSSIDQLPLSSFSEFDHILLNKYINIIGTRKYLGEEQYILSGGYYKLDATNVVNNFVSGNNWFYWPSGEYFRENPSDIIFDPVSIEDTTLITDGAVAGKTYNTSDRIFVQTGESISGAWLRYTEQYDREYEMQASLFTGRSTKFRFPYPGYGLSGEGIAWTGPQLINALPIERYDEKVLDLYFRTTPTSAIEPISIHDTTLVDNGAYPAQEYYLADEISVRNTPNPDKLHDLTPDEIYKEGFYRAWLYKMLKTDLPIAVGQNYIHWPIYTYKKDLATHPMEILSGQCIPVALSSIPVETTIIGARAGYGEYDSDLLYKLDAPNGYPIECAVLSGAELSTLASQETTRMFAASGKIQPSLTLKIRPGNLERFVWQDSATYISDTTINHHNHQVDCPYLLQKHKSIFNTQGKSLPDLATNGIGNWNICTCRAIKYSPLGHPGQKYSDYNYMADTIFVDTQFPEQFDLNSWRGRDGLPYTQSKDFAFFQLSGNDVEVDVGWGNGQWKTGDGSSFRFEPGVIYRYLRSNINRNPADLILNALPDLIVKQEHYNTPKVKWVKAILDDNGNWKHTNQISDMVLNPGDYLMYDHIDSNWWCLTADGDYGRTISRNNSAINFGSEWANYNFVTSGTNIELTWPNISYKNGPLHVVTELTAIDWVITQPDSTYYTRTRLDPLLSVNFLTDLYGTYTIEATGYGPFGSEVATGIPAVSSVPNSITYGISGSLDIITTYNDRINLLVNVPLSGWNYTTGMYTGVNRGGRPFWAKAYDNSSKQTKNKGTMKWGGGIRTTIDDYTLVTQPDVANLSLSSNAFVDYVRRGDTTIFWEQPVSFIVNEETKQWCKLLVDNSKVSPLIDYLYNITNEMIISATNEPSDIIFTNENDMFVNYWSMSESFTWTQPLINSTNGFPPTGGLWVPWVSGELIDPLVPYANLTNRHYPTIATAPYVGGLYTVKESGGYFVPRMLGASVYTGKGWTNTIDAGTLTNTVSDRGNTSIFRNPEIYIGEDRGLSHMNQTSPIVNIDNDQRWQKGKITEGLKAGDVVGVREYQEYIPYQTKYESTGFNFNGLHVQSDQYDPWTGSTDSMWADPTYFPPNFRNEYDIDGWYNNRLPKNTFVYQWKSDIFGNQYALLKDTSLNGIYNKRQAYGEMWIRNQESIIAPISALFPTYDLFQDSLSSISYSIKDFDLWYDTLMLKTSSHVIIEHINFDWDNNRIYTIADDINILDLEALGGGHYGGHWLFDEEKRLTLCQVVSDSYNNTVYPILYNYDIDTVERTTLFNLSGHPLVNSLSSVNLGSIEDPVFSYNENTKNYNLTFVGHSSDYVGVIITTMTINHNTGLRSVYSITPTPSS